MHKSIAFFARIASISAFLFLAIDASAECIPGSVNAEHSCGKDNYDPNYKNRPKPSGSGRADTGSGYGSSSSSSSSFSSSSSSSSSSGAEAAAAASALQSIGNYLQDQSDQKDEQERQQRLEQDRVDAEDQQRQEAQGQQSYRALESFEASMAGSDWESRAAASSGSGSSKGKTPAQTSSTGDCNCKESAGICTATVVVVKKRATGADFKVTSSAPRCSKVNYYIDNTPRLTVLNNTNTAMEHAAGLTQITNKTFEVESCHVCASK